MCTIDSRGSRWQGIERAVRCGLQSLLSLVCLYRSPQVRHNSSTVQHLGLPTAIHSSQDVFRDWSQLPALNQLDHLVARATIHVGQNSLRDGWQAERKNPGGLKQLGVKI